MWISSLHCAKIPTGWRWCLPCLSWNRLFQHLISYLIHWFQTPLSIGWNLLTNARLIQKHTYLPTEGILHRLFSVIHSWKPSSKQDRECVRNLDLRVQTISTSVSPWAIMEEEGIHICDLVLWKMVLYLSNTKGQEISKGTPMPK